MISTGVSGRGAKRRAMGWVGSEASGGVLVKAPAVAERQMASCFCCRFAPALRPFHLLALGIARVTGVPLLAVLGDIVLLREYPVGRNLVPSNLGGNGSRRNGLVIGVGLLLNHKLCDERVAVRSEATSGRLLVIVVGDNLPLLRSAPPALVQSHLSPDRRMRCRVSSCSSLEFRRCR